MDESQNDDRNEIDSLKNQINNSKLSRRTFIKAGVGGAALVGVALSVDSPQLLSKTSASSTTTDPFAAQTITLNVNNKSYQVAVEPRDMLNNVLRDFLGLIGTKRPCNRMECGGCTVLIDGVPHMSCTYMALHAVGKQILTVEGTSVEPVLSALQNAWVQADGGQCSYCQPGQIMSATALLKQDSNPSVDDIKLSQSGNICRCGNYAGIIAAIQLAAQNLQGGSTT